ncbi:MULTISPECIES: hypothetical protein [unclassified Micromonospora]|uniref:hypothetical protein n=1 Tax=unclassified Micromonospora TaxID=2617518 RepID=UPI003A875750
MPAAPVERLVNLLGGCAHGDAGECGSSGSRSAGNRPLPAVLPLPGRTSAPDVTVGMTGTAMV